MRRVGLVATLLATVALGATEPAGANPGLYPIDLQVAGGEEEWHVDDIFQLTWTRPPSAEEDPIAMVGYRVRDPAGEVVVPITRLPGDRTAIDIRVPPLPGTYMADVWLEGADQERGPVRGVALRYDHARPGIPLPVAGEDWVAGSMPASISIRPPAEAPPVSGIRGYAISIDRGGEIWPCVTRSRCEDADVDLPAAGEGVLSLGTLPEGPTIVRAVAVSGAGVPSAEAGSAVVRVDATPPTVRLEGAPAGWSNEPVPLVARAADSLSGMSPRGPNGPQTAIAVDNGVPRVEIGDAAGTTVVGEGVHRVSLYARDAAGNSGDRSPVTATVPIDESPPRLAFASAQDPAEPERLEATIADALSGPDPDRGSIGAREAGTSGPWRALPTAVRAGRLVAHWDSGSFPEGVYEFRVTGYDRAGNVAAANQRANHTRMVLVNPLKGQARLLAGPLGDRDATISPFGRRIPYGGRLSTAAGAPLGGLPVRVVESFGPGAAERERSTMVVTAADGSFAIRLPRGPSREVDARFAGTPTLGPAAAGPARLSVLGSVTLRASAPTARVGGAPVVFSGRVGRLGARLPSGGLPVELRFRVPGGEWSEFRTVRTDPRGRFRFAYAFSDDDSRGVRFRFRASVGGGDWPYEPVASKAVSVTGR